MSEGEKESRILGTNSIVSGWSWDQSGQTEGQDRGRRTRQDAWAVLVQGRWGQLDQGSGDEE